MALDQYGGWDDLPVEGGGTGHFRVGKRGNRWFWVTPLGNAFWMRGCYNVTADDTHTDEVPPLVGMTVKQFLARKYGTTYQWAKQTNTRLRAWGFNALNEYAMTYTLPWATGVSPAWPEGTNPVKLAANCFPLNCAWYAKINHSNLLGDNRKAVKDICHYGGGLRYPPIDPGHLPDVFDPNFVTYITLRLQHPTIRAAALSPYCLGLTSDDGDFLRGFGAGPDFPTIPAGKTHLHVGYVCATTRPTQTTVPTSFIPGGVPYADPTVHSKLAWRNFLISRYGSGQSGLNALNNGWATGGYYTSWGQAGGYGVGTGVLDEDGNPAKPWWGKYTHQLTNANPTLRKDLDDFLYEFARHYFTVYRTAIDAAYPGVMFLGCTTTGNWNAPTRRQIMEAAAPHVDVFRAQLVSGSDFQSRVDFVALHVGDKPLALWLGAVANPDSRMNRPNGGQSVTHPTQTARAAWYVESLRRFLALVAGPTGNHPIIGIQWWCWMDMWTEHANWGLVSMADNAYDGVEAQVVRGLDPWGYPCGGEQQDWGDFLTSVKAANDGVHDTILGKLPPSAPKDIITR